MEAHDEHKYWVEMIEVVMERTRIWRGRLKNPTFDDDDVEQEFMVKAISIMHKCKGKSAASFRGFIGVSLDNYAKRLLDKFIRTCDYRNMQDIDDMGNLEEQYVEDYSDMLEAIMVLDDESDIQFLMSYLDMPHEVDVMWENLKISDPIYRRWGHPPIRVYARFVGVSKNRVRRILKKVRYIMECREKTAQWRQIYNTLAKRGMIVVSPKDIADETGVSRQRAHQIMLKWEHHGLVRKPSKHERIMTHGSKNKA